MSQYDPGAVTEINEIAKKIDRFYGELLETPKGRREYEKFKERYIEVAVDLRFLVLHNELRGELNTPSIKQAKIVHDLWMNDKRSIKPVVIR